MDLKDEVEEVRKELADLITKHLRENKIDVQKARQEAGDFLAILPIKDQLDLLTKLKNLGKKYNEAEKVYLTELEKFEDMKRDQILSQIRDFIKQGNIESAIAMAKTLTSPQ